MFKKFIFIFLAIFVVDIAVSSSIYFCLPDPKKLTKGIALERTGSDGKIFTFVAGPKNKKFIPLTKIPKILQSAVLTLEDARFYSHLGFDIEEIQNALSSSLEEGSRLRGASGISQQLVKNLYLSSDRTLRRKLLEALITIKLELNLTKSQILELYLNSIDWGRGLFGISDAAAYYFKVNPSDLTPKQSVFLAAIIPNPSRFGKFGDDQLPKKFVRKQMMKALQNLYRNGSLNFADFQEVMEHPYEFSGDKF